MAVTLIIEDGSNVADANTFVSVAEVRTYAGNRGITLPVDDDAVAVMIIKSMDGLLLYSDQWQGERTNEQAGVETPQELDWPRECVYIRGSLWAKDAIPADLKRGQCQLVCEIANGVVLTPTVSTDKFVIEKTVGPITTKWSEGVALNSSTLPTLPLVDSILAPLVKSGGGPSRSYRV